MSKLVRPLVLVAVAWGPSACGDEPPAAGAPTEETLSSGGEIPADDAAEPPRGELDEGPIEDPYGDDEAHDDEEGPHGDEAEDDDYDEEAAEDEEPFDRAH